MSETGQEQVWVEVIDVNMVANREISVGASLAQGIEERQEDIQAAVKAGAETVAKSLKSLSSPEGWHLGEVSASFGITLTAEAGVILSKASAGATFEVAVKFTKA